MPNLTREFGFLQVGSPRANTVNTDETIFLPDLNPKPYIYYTLSILIELNSR